MKRTWTLLLIGSAICAGQPPSLRVDRVAGIRPGAPDAEPSREALLAIPYGVAVDVTGNVYFHDRNNHVIRRLSTGGVLTRFAGNGLVGSTGDGGPASEASLNYDIGSMTFGQDGALYFADGWNCTVRRITAAGRMERVAGLPGQCGFSGDGGPAASARLNVLGTVSFDRAGNLYIGDGFNNRIRRVRTDGIIETFAGTGRAGFSGDGGPAAEAQLALCVAQVDAQDNVWIMDALNYRIRRVTRDGIINTVAGNGVPGPTPDEGPALTSSIGFVTYGQAHPDGSFYFADQGRIAMFALTAGGTIRRIAGAGDRFGLGGDGGPAVQAGLTTAQGFAIAPDGSVYFSDQLNHLVRRFVPGGVVETVAGRRRFDANYGVAWEQVLNGPVAVAWDPRGGYYIYEQFGARIRRVDPDGTMITVAGTGEHGATGDGGAARKAQVGLVTGPAAASLAVDSLGRVYLADAQIPRVRRFTPGGLVETVAGTETRGYSGDGGPATEAQLNGPSAVAVAPDGRIFVSDTNNHRIRVIDTAGVIRTFAGTGEAGYSGDGGPASSARITSPGAIAIDRGRVYFIDGGNRIRAIGADGVITTLAGSGRTGAPVDGPALEVPLSNLVTLTALPDGTLLFGESSSFFPSSRLRHLGADGRIVSLSPATAGYQGEGTPLSQARFSSIGQISASTYGEILVSDRDNNVIRMLWPANR